MFIHNFYFYVYVIFIFTTFWCFTCKNLQRIFPPISDNNYFILFPIYLFIHIFDAFNCLASNSICRGVVPRIIFVLFPIRTIHFSLTINMSYLPLNFPTLITFMVLPFFSITIQPVISQFFVIDSLYIPCYPTM